MSAKGTSRDPLTREIEEEGGGIGLRRCRDVVEGKMDLTRPRPRVRDVEKAGIVEVGS